MGRSVPTLGAGAVNPAHRGVVRVGEGLFFIRVLSDACPGGMPMLYNTGTSQFYLNFNSARLLLGDNFLRDNQHNVRVFHSQDSHGRLVTEYQLPTVTVEVENPLGGTCKVLAAPTVSRYGENLFGVTSIAQLPFQVEFVPLVEVELRATKGSVPTNWMRTMDAPV